MMDIKYCCDDCLYNKNCQFIAKYKTGAVDCDCFEDGNKFFELTYNIGDTLYCIYKDSLQDMKKSANKQPKPFLRITEAKINSILIDKNGIRYLLNIVNPSTAFESEFGKTVFPTKAEAEKALVGRNENG